MMRRNDGGEHLPARRPPSGAVEPSGRLPSIPPPRLPSERAVPDVPFHTAGELGLLADGMIRDDYWLKMPERVRTLLLDRAGELVEWWADRHRASSGDGIKAVVMGTNALCTAKPRFDHRRARLVFDLNYHVFQPDSLRQRSVVSEPILRSSAALASPGSGLALTNDPPAPPLPGLSATACGVLGNLPRKAQRLLQSPFAITGQIIHECDWYYLGYANTAELSMFAVYLCSATEVTFANGTRTADGTWSLTCHAALLRPRNPGS
jgi:hypothetical protein